MGYWSDWYDKNAGKESCLVSAEFVLRALDKIPTSMPPTAHSHTKSEITDFPASMAPTVHTHTVSDITDLYNKIYPVGSIYISVNNTNPGTYLTGTIWAVWGSGRVPVGVDTGQTEFNTVEKTGGEKNHTLTVNEMPSHSHSIQKYSGNNSCSTGSGAAHGYWENRQDSTISSNLTGGGAGHNNLQPYITCYMFKRTS
jgi:hypothetical protein